MGCGNAKVKPKEPQGAVPEGFPIEIKDYAYQNWSYSIADDSVFIAKPKDEDEVVKICNWALEKQWRVRAMGVRHNWSPLTIGTFNKQMDDKVVLLDMTANFNKFHGVTPAKDGQPAVADVEPGMSHLPFLTALEEAEGGNGDIGYGVTHAPAPESITVGGMLAINGHGTAIPNKYDEKNGLPAAKTPYCTYSNRVVGLRAVVYDEGSKRYLAKQFTRGDPEADALICHLGRTIVTRVQLQVENNYYMRCMSYLNISADTMFPNPEDIDAAPPVRSMGWYVELYGRAEAIWYPFTDNPWLKVWEVTGSEKPESSRAVDGACNYPFCDTLPGWITSVYKNLVDADATEELERARESACTQVKEYCQDIVGLADGLESGEDEQDRPWPGKSALSALGEAVVDGVTNLFGSSKLTPTIGKAIYFITARGLKSNEAYDIWGPSKNTLIYVRDSTLRVTANGYAILMKRKHVTKGIAVFVEIYKNLMKDFQERGEYPINAPLEIRVSGLDDPSMIGDGNGRSPAISACHYDASAKEQQFDCVLWLDVLSMPGTKGANEFYERMEQQMLKEPMYQLPYGIIRPEWSKGWGYTAEEGPWANASFRDFSRKGLPEWNNAVKTYDKLDGGGLYQNAFLKEFTTAV